MILELIYELTKIYCEHHEAASPSRLKIPEKLKGEFSSEIRHHYRRLGQAVDTTQYMGMRIEWIEWSAIQVDT